MKKGILLIGPSESGKSRMADHFCTGRNSAILYGKQFNVLKNHYNINNNTEVLVIDDICINKTPIDWFFSLIRKGVKVYQKNVPISVIFPKIIISAVGSMVDIPKGTDKYFDIFELKRCNVSRNKDSILSKLYYIKNGYIGNAILWWGVNSKGYTTDICKAGKYTKEEAIEITKRPEGEAWLCDYIDNNYESNKSTVDCQYLKSTKINCIKGNI